jgi:hypothetical protein
VLIVVVVNNSPHGSVVERVTSNDKVVSSILAVGKNIPEKGDIPFAAEYFLSVLSPDPSETAHGVLA